MDLDVYLDQALAGRLTHDPESNLFAFEYARSWLDQADAYPLSPALPLTLPAVTPDEHSAAVRRFFENLLPEGQALDDAASAYRVSKSNTAGLLAALGRETAGAVRLVVPGTEEAEQNQRRLLTGDEFSKRIRDRPNVPFTVWDGRVRLSIAGFQDKLAVLEDGNDWYLVDGPDLASTVILKPEPLYERLAGLTSNEFFCMRLASAAGLSAAHVELRHVPEPVLVVKRFDRRHDGKDIRRLHVIDGCQLLGLPSSHKYERLYGESRDVREIRDGASLPRFFSALGQAAQPAKARLDLLRWTVYQVLLGNADAHAKNLSFFMTPDGPIQAPSYDVVCSAIYAADEISQTFAMAVGDAFGLEELSALEWAQFCALTGINPTLVRREIERGVKAVTDAIDFVAAEAVNAGADRAVIEAITAVVGRESARQLEFAPAIREMMDWV